MTISNVLPAPLRSVINTPNIPGLSDADVTGTGVSVIRFDGQENGSLKLDVSAGGAVSGMSGMITGGGGVSAKVKFNAEQLSGHAQLKAEAGVNSDLSKPLSAFINTLQGAQHALGAVKSNVDPADFNDPEKALALITSLKKDEFLMGAYLLNGSQLYYRGTLATSPQAVIDVAKGARTL